MNGRRTLCMIGHRPLAGRGLAALIAQALAVGTERMANADKFVTNKHGYYFVIKANVLVDVDALLISGCALDQSREEMYKRASQITGIPADELVGFEHTIAIKNDRIVVSDHRGATKPIEEDFGRGRAVSVEEYLLDYME